MAKTRSQQIFAIDDSGKWKCSEKHCLTLLSFRCVSLDDQWTYFRSWVCEKCKKIKNMQIIPFYFKRIVTNRVFRWFCGVSYTRWEWSVTRRTWLWLMKVYGIPKTTNAQFSIGILHDIRPNQSLKANRTVKFTIENLHQNHQFEKMDSLEMVCPNFGLHNSITRFYMIHILIIWHHKRLWQIKWWTFIFLWHFLEPRHRSPSTRGDIF